MSPAGLALLFDRAGGSLNETMRDVIVTMESNSTNADHLISESPIERMTRRKRLLLFCLCHNCCFYFLISSFLYFFISLFLYFF